MLRRWPVLLMFVALVSSSCTSASPADDAVPPSDPDGEPTTTAERGDDIPTALPFDDDRAIGDEVIRIALVRPETYLPSEIPLADQGSVIVADLLYDGLTEADVRDGALRPGLARSWTANEDLTHWNFVLDTNRVDAETVVAHFQALASEATGAAAVAVGHLRSVELVSAGEVRFVLDRPDGGFPWLLSGVGYSVTGVGGDPTGWYRIDGDDDDHMALRSRLDGRPDVILAWKPSARDAYNSLTLGVVDMAIAPADALDDARSRFGATPPARAISRFLVLRRGSPELNDPRLAQAIGLAIDRDAIAADIDGWFGLGGLLAPTLSGYEPSRCGTGCQPDLARAALLAAQLIDERGEKPPISIGVLSSATEQDLTGTVARQLREVGFIVDVVESQPVDHAIEIEDGPTAIVAGGWVAPATSLDAVVPAILGTTIVLGPDWVSSVEVQSILDRAASTTDDDARWRLLAEAHERALGGGSIIPIGLPSSYLIAAPSWQHVSVRADGSIDLGGGQYGARSTPRDDTILEPRRSGGIGRRASLRG